jgi:hypothetical protein
MPNKWTKATQAIYEFFNGPRTVDTEFNLKVEELNSIMNSMKIITSIIKNFPNQTMGLKNFCQSIYNNLTECYKGNSIYIPLIIDICDSHKKIETAYLNLCENITKIENGNLEWKKKFTEVQNSLINREETRKVYDHYDEKMEKLVKERNNKLSKGENEDIKDIEKFDRNDGKYKKAASDFIQMSNYSYRIIQDLLDYRYQILNPIICNVVNEEKNFFDSCSNFFSKFGNISQKIEGLNKGFQKSPINYDGAKYCRAARLLQGLNTSCLPEIKNKEKYSYENYQNKKINNNMNNNNKTNNYGYGNSGNSNYENNSYNNYNQSNNMYNNYQSKNTNLNKNANNYNSSNNYSSKNQNLNNNIYNNYQNNNYQNNNYNNYQNNNYNNYQNNNYQKNNYQDYNYQNNNYQNNNYQNSNYQNSNYQNSNFNNNNKNIRQHNIKPNYNSNTMTNEENDNRPIGGGMENSKNNPEMGEAKGTCSHCGRQFVYTALEKHEKICQKVFQNKRKAFNTQQQRIKNSEQAVLMKQGQIEEKKKEKMGLTKNKNSIPKWKLQSEEFRQICRGGSEPISNKNKNTFNSEISKNYANYKPSVITDSYIPCKFCNRKYNEEAYKKHLNGCERRYNDALLKNKFKKNNGNSMNEALSKRGIYGQKKNIK